MFKITSFVLLASLISSNISLLQRDRPASSIPIMDTLIDVGGRQLHFNVWKGKSPAILFETGAGDDLSVWSDILAPIYKNTGATLITYDRAGFGKSTLDSNQITLKQQLDALTTGLTKLDLSDNYLLVAHSFGGYFSTLLANKYPEKIKGMVLLDPNQAAFWTDAQTKDYWSQYASMKQAFKKENPGVYWLMVNAYQNTREMRQVTFPSTIPVIDIVAETPPWKTAKENAQWHQAQKQFVAGSPSRKLIMAIGSGHYIMRDKPELVIKTITQLYKTAQVKGN
jgi:pimeloyl-ACP methyl ester carboxylesterase